MHQTRWTRRHADAFDQPSDYDLVARFFGLLGQVVALTESVIPIPNLGLALVSKTNQQNLSKTNEVSGVVFFLGEKNNGKRIEVLFLQDESIRSFG